jgi:hypothetical protein
MDAAHTIKNRVPARRPATASHAAKCPRNADRRRFPFDAIKAGVERLRVGERGSVPLLGDTGGTLPLLRSANP